jgi:outer membrane protein OmpA-like peptidoglycan-associated protein
MLLRTVLPFMLIHACAVLAPLLSQTAQPEMTALKSTFVPGAKTIFYDDFSDMAPDSPPPHFKVRGAAPQLMAAGDTRQLTITARGSLFPNITSLPKNFTFEGEYKFETKARELINIMFAAGNKQILHLTISAMAKDADLAVSLRAPYQELGRKRIPADWSQPAKLALWVQDGRLRVFLNGEKHLDFNQVEMPPLSSVEFAHDFYGANQSIGYRSIRFAESTPDFSQVIMSSGRYVTQGITFDTASDRIKEESASVIQLVAKGLQDNPSLKLLIEGHTDSVGAPAANMDLSRRRAEAVKSVLVSQFKVDAARLTAAGLGATKPVGPNDSPHGRAQNRRVEFVKQ